MKVCYFHLVSNLIQLKINGSPWLSGHTDIQNSTALNVVSTVLKPSTEQQGWILPQASALKSLGTETDLNPTRSITSQHSLMQRGAIWLCRVGWEQRRNVIHVKMEAASRSLPGGWWATLYMCAIVHASTYWVSIQACKYIHKPRSIHTYT